VQTATGDLWSAFRGRKAPAAPSGGIAGDLTADASGQGPQLAIGAGLLGLGLVALLGAFAVAETRRRRAPAGGS
jgi:hypothetical protein